VEHFAPFEEERIIGHFLGQSMLEGILYLRERRLLVEKFLVLERREEAV
jgi:hypothetical protein